MPSPFDPNPALRDASDRAGGGAPAASRYAIGQPVLRQEDPILVRGEGRYTDDNARDGQVYASFVRSPYAHGTITTLDTDAARDGDGVLAVLTAADLAAYAPFGNITGLKSRDGTPLRRPERRSLATDRVRFVGDPVAVVIAETPFAARDAAEAVLLDVDILPAVPTARDAVAPDAPDLYDDVPGNVALDFAAGDEGAVKAAFAGAAHVTRLHLDSHRLVVSPMEPRSALAEYDPETERFTLTIGCQGAFGFRAAIAGLMNIPVEKLRIVTGHVGGSFGMKFAPHPEYVPLLHAARALGRPVRWTDTRSESFMSDFHGRGIEVDAELALDADGRFLAIRIDGLADIGAFVSHVAPMFSSKNVIQNLPGAYRTPAASIRMRCCLTNAVPVGAYRGAGRPEGNYITERLIDAAAHETGRDPAALRRLNHIAPDALPFATPVGTTYDSGEFTAILDRALAAADWDGFEQRAAESARQGRVRGRGIGQYVEVTAPPTNEMGGIHFEADGTVTIVTGTLDYGQGHWTPFAQVLSDRLGIPFESIRLVQGDSDRLIAGGGTGGSKSIMASGAAIAEASAKVVEKGRVAAADLLEAGVADIEFENGTFRIAGTDREIGIMELATALRTGEAAKTSVTSLDVDHIHGSSPSAYPNGVHVAEVEIDRDTGVVTVERYVMVNDFGVVVNPLLVEGQLHGGVVQGIGQALMERAVVDASGQLVTGSYMDYALPRAEDAPAFVFESRPVPTSTNPLGVKGCGEAGCAGSITAVMNALTDAFWRAGAEPVEMPATPDKVWRALRDAKRAA